MSSLRCSLGSARWRCPQGWQLSLMASGQVCHGNIHRWQKNREKQLQSAKAPSGAVNKNKIKRQYQTFPWHFAPQKICGGGGAVCGASELWFGNRSLFPWGVQPCCSVSLHCLSHPLDQATNWAMSQSKAVTGCQSLVVWYFWVLCFQLILQRPKSEILVGVCLHD